MQIEEVDLPYAGERFEFAVIEGTKPIRIDVYLDQRQMLSIDCPDPPCHEFVMIPPGTRGAELWVIAKDSNGNTEQKKYMVAETDSSAGGSMSAAM